MLAIIKKSLRIKENYTPEKRIRGLFISVGKKMFLVIVALITYWQLYQYISEKPEIDISIEKSVIINKNYKTTITVANGSQSITSSDIVEEISIIFNDTIQQIKSVASNI